MSTSALTAKKVRLAIKHNISMTELCDQCGISADECETFIRKTFRESEARKIIRSLYRNIKPMAGSKPATNNIPADKQADVKDQFDAQATKSNAEDQSDVQATSTVSLDSTGFVLPIITVETLAAATLAELEHNEKLYSKHAIALENQHADLYRKYIAHEKDLSVVRKEVREIKAMLEEKRQRVEEIIDAENSIFGQMNELSADHLITTANLSYIREEKESRAVVNVFVYDDGDIESEDANLKLDTSGYEEFYHDFCDNTPVACENLRLRDLTVLAKVFAIIKNGTSRKVCFTFENTAIEKAYAEQSIHS